VYVLLIQYNKKNVKAIFYYMKSTTNFVLFYDKLARMK